MMGHRPSPRLVPAPVGGGGGGVCAGTRLGGGGGREPRLRSEPAPPPPATPSPSSLLISGYSSFLMKEGGRGMYQTLIVNGTQACFKGFFKQEKGNIK